MGYFPFFHGVKEQTTGVSADFHQLIIQGGQLGRTDFAVKGIVNADHGHIFGNFPAVIF